MAAGWALEADLHPLLEARHVVLVVARCLHEVLCLPLRGLRGVDYLHPQRSHADDAVFVFPLDLGLLIVYYLLPRELMEVVVSVKVASPALRHEESRVPLLLLKNKNRLEGHEGSEDADSKIAGRRIEEVLGAAP